MVGRMERRTRPLPPPDPVRQLSEALLGAELVKHPLSLRINFDDKRDTAVVLKVLRGWQENYVPDKNCD